MAFELIAGERGKRKSSASTHVSISASVEADTLIEILEFAKTREVSRSAAMRQLLIAGLVYEITIAPELRKRADEMQKFSQIFGDFEKKWPKFIDVEEIFSFYASEPVNERQSSVAAEAV
jgi:hypothetical protein